MALDLAAALLHLAGLAEDAVDEIAEVLDLGAAGELAGKVLEHLPVMGGFLPGLADELENLGERRLDLPARVADRVGGVVGAEVRRVDLLAALGGQRLVLFQNAVDRAVELGVLPGAVRVPDREVLGVGRHVVLGHQLHGGAGVCPRYLVGLEVLHYARPLRHPPRPPAIMGRPRPARHRGGRALPRVRLDPVLRPRGRRLLDAG